MDAEDHKEVVEAAVWVATIWAVPAAEWAATTWVVPAAEWAATTWVVQAAVWAVQVVVCLQTWVAEWVEEETLTCRWATKQ